jgi:hypothetical protein
MYVDIKNKKELLSRREEIFQLFLDSFGRPLSFEEWHWFYIDNPVGEPYVSLFYEDGRLLGHYAVLPTLLTYKKNSFVGYRSMTTMVHPDGRGKKLFTELAKRVYSMLESDGAALVYGFPNANSAPGFVRNLGWTLLDPDKVCDFTGKEIIENELIQTALLRNADIEWSYLDLNQAKWRYSIPGFSVEEEKGLVVKEYKGVYNILHLDNRGLVAIHEDRKYRVLLSGDVSNFIPGLVPIFDYQFGFRIFDKNYADAQFRREFVMSDVF